MSREVTGGLRKLREYSNVYITKYKGYDISEGDSFMICSMPGTKPLGES
jgi:hypothetical protein